MELGHHLNFVTPTSSHSRDQPTGPLRCVGTAGKHLPADVPGNGERHGEANEAQQELRTGNVTRKDILAMAEQLVGPDYVPR